jgi:rhodanese-related sulfurtransferase
MEPASRLQPAGGMQTITTDQLRRELDAATHPIVVDVLPPKDFRASHLPSAINVPIGPYFDQQIQRAVPDKNQRVVVYCRNNECAASEQAADAMERAGYTNVMRYQGGIDEWTETGLPVEH